MLGAALLLGQLAWRGPASPWTPFHEHAVYRLEVEVDGARLTGRAALARYRLPAWHFSDARQENWETNDLAHVQRVITETEARAARPAQRVVLEARRNGERLPPWRLER